MECDIVNATQILAIALFCVTLELGTFSYLTKCILKCIFKRMNYITTTDLRTKSSQLIKSLRNGDSISLIHRSKVVGVIKPAIEPKKFDVDAFKRAIKDLNLPKTTYEKREKIYREHLMNKYGKNLSGR